VVTREWITLLYWAQIVAGVAAGIAIQASLIHAVPADFWWTVGVCAVFSVIFAAVGYGLTGKAVE
jgi:hypothetical protein